MKRLLGLVMVRSHILVRARGPETGRETRSGYFYLRATALDALDGKAN